MYLPRYVLSFLATWLRNISAVEEPLAPPNANDDAEQPWLYGGVPVEGNFDQLDENSIHSNGVSKVREERMAC